MSFLEMKKILEYILKNHYEDYIKAIISIETNKTDLTELDKIYKNFMKINNLQLLNPEILNTKKEDVMSSP